MRSSNIVSKHAFDFQPRIAHLADFLNGLHQLGDAFEREVFALNGNENAVGGDQGIDRQDVQRRRTINQNEIKIRSNGARAASRR